MLTQSQVRKHFTYSPETGEFTWLPPSWMAGRRAGFLNAKGYRKIRFAGTDRSAARMAWLYVYGEWPSREIDHINGDRGDDRIANLRLATRAENNRNKVRRSDSKTGFKGVNFQNRHWRARIQINGKMLHLGYFPTAEEAHAAYCEAAKKHFGEFARAE